MYEAHDDLSHVALADMFEGSGEPVPHVPTDRFGQDWGASLSEALAAVEIISSDSSAKSAEAAVSALTRIYFSLTSQKPELRTSEKLAELHSTYHDHRSRYIDAARTELATFSG